MDHLVNRMAIFIPMMFHETASLDKYVAVVCEYEDADVIWPKFPINTSHIVESRAWFKNQTPIASWTIENRFNELPDYQGRLKQIGESDIKIKRATRSDSGTYIQILRLQSVQDTLTVSTRLHVTVVPSSGCKPRVTNQGQNLKAVLPSNDCVNSLLTLNWKQTDNFVMNQNGSSLLKLTPETKEYVVCAEGESAKCFQGNMSDLCTNQTAKEELQHRPLPDHSAVVLVVCAILIFCVMIICVIVLKRRSLRRKFCRDTNEETHQGENDRSMENAENGTNEREAFPLLKKSESIDLSQIKDYLLKRYMTETYIPEFPVHEGKSVNVSDVYVELDMKQIALDVIDAQDETDLSSTIPLFFKEATVKKHDKHLPPIVIVGDSGSGKSTWCKHLVHCWSENLKMDEAEVQSMNLPDLRTFKMVLYLPLKISDCRLSFRELLQQYLFPAQISYLEFVMNYMDEQNHVQSILTVIDGLDKIGKQYSLELFAELLDHKLLSSSAFIFTTKPSNFNRICLFCNNRSMKFFKIQDLTLAKSTTYANKVLTTINKHSYTDFSVDDFLKFTEYLFVECLLKLPYHCLTLLFLWMENKNHHIDIIYILSHIIENHVKNAQSCNPKIKEILERCEPPESINKLSHQGLLSQHLVNSLSMLADKIFQSKEKISSVEEGAYHENLTRECDMLTLEVGCELGFITEPLSFESTENLSMVIFTNMLIFNFFVSMAVALRKGPTFDYIVSGTNAALENSLIIHILCQLSPALGKEIFNAMEKQKSKKGESQDELNKCSIKRKRKRHLSTENANPRAESVWWLQHLMSKGELDGEKLLFLTNSLRFIVSLTVLELTDHEYKKDLIFWLPYSQTLTKLTLDINNCTLLLCQEWNNPESISLKEVKIKSVSMYLNTRSVFANVFKHCLCKIDFDPKYIWSNIDISMSIRSI